MERKPDAAPATWRELLTREHGPALALVAMGVWLHAADSLLVATMMPVMISDIGGAHWVAWTVALYEVGSIVAGVGSGLMAIRFGVRMPMSSAALLFAVGCVVSAVAPSMEIVLLGRLLQGLGGGALVALSFVAVGVFFELRLTARVMAVVSTLWGVSAFLGPMVGAVFATYFSWRGGFWFFAIQAIALGVWILTRVGVGAATPGRRTAGALPLARLVLVASGVILAARGGIETAPLATMLNLAAGLACLAVFLILDARRGADRLLPLGTLDPRTRSGSALLMVLCFSIATIALGTYGPLLLTMVHDTSILAAGYVLAFESVGWSIAAVLVSGAPQRHDPRYIAVGMTAVAISSVGHAYAVPQGPVWLVTVFAVMAGAGFGTGWTFILRRVTAGAVGGERDRIAAAFPTAQRLGYALGAALIGIVANAAGMGRAGDADAARRVALFVFLACLPFAAAGLAAAVRFVTSPPGRAPDERVE